MLQMSLCKHIGSVGSILINTCPPKVGIQELYFVDENCRQNDKEKYRTMLDHIKGQLGLRRSATLNLFADWGVPEPQCSM